MMRDRGLVAAALIPVQLLLALLPGSAVDGFLHLQAASDLGLDVVVPVGRLAHSLLILSAIPHGVHRLLDYVCFFILIEISRGNIRLLPQIFNAPLVVLPRLGFQLRALVSIEGED